VSAVSVTVTNTALLLRGDIAPSDRELIELRRYGAQTANALMVPAKTATPEACHPLAGDPPTGPLKLTPTIPLVE
jgi:hypothetical protein